ncbi:TetR/AcrR family transcriptional regulator [Nocardioides sp. R-C-SC26]|uniref:TetR/AcrR family transcriptional regulator n=1 Tax=Nocardioides sp. R-C-SC26 TaxID=2870414 RepID=UPI001E4999E9|nr:TetR/AcrR family transcriptional regulator [Nocardioides sp. R-C-SC26]
MSMVNGSETRRAAWSPLPVSLSKEPRQRILDAAVRVIAKHGLEKVTVAAVAREAGVSRQTIYTYYSNRDDIVRDAVDDTARQIVDHLHEQCRSAPTAADFMVELTTHAYDAISHSPVIATLLSALDTTEGRALTMSPAVIAVVRDMHAPLAAYQPDLAERLDEIAETGLRLMVSLLTYPSDVTRDESALRTYIRRVMVPAAGISV